MQSQDFFGADTMIHSLLMRYLDRGSFTVHAACNRGTKDSPSASLRVLQTIPVLYVRSTDFGVSVYNRRSDEIIREVLPGAAAAAASLVSLAAYIKKHRIDIIHCTEKPRDAFYGLLLARVTGARCVIHLHVKAENWIKPMVRWSMQQADALIGVSNFVSNSIIELGYRREKVHTVLNSLDLSRWNNQADGSLDPNGWDNRNDGSAVRREFRLAPDLPIMAVVSRLSPWKGHTELLQALAIVKERQPRFKLLLVGEDDPRATPGGGSYSAQLRALTEELGLTEQIIFTGFRRDVPHIMAACDVYTMPSFEEPFGVVFLEAMAMRKPVIALDNGGTREVVEHGKAGLLSRPKDVQELADNILTLLNDAELRQRMGAYGRRLVEERYTAQRMAHDTEQIYRRLVAKGPATHAQPRAAGTVEHK